MFIKNIQYGVLITDYAKKHFEKDFQKKYKSNWSLTLQSILDSLERIYFFQEKEQLSIIKYSNDGKLGIIKFEFKIFNSKESAKTSGNRILAIINNDTKIVSVALIYSKNHITISNETNWWKEHIQNNFYYESNIIGLHKT